ncbi:hypothetical protein Tco_0211802 [Tanacetum coccineum]
MDAEIAQRLYEEEQAQFEREQRIARERAAEQEVKDAALITEFEDNESFEEIQKLYEKELNWIRDFIPMDSEEGGKKAASNKKRPRA